MRPLYRHQAEALAYCRRVRHPLLFLEMRLGKTLVVLRRLKELAREGVALRALVVAPRSALASWREECAREEIATTDLSSGSRKKRLAALLGFRDGIALLNREGWRALPEIAAKSWNAVVLDEAHFIKNPRAAVTKFFLRKFAGVPYRFALTGTPCGEGEQDAVCLLRWGARRPGGCSDFWSFRQKWMEPSFGGYGWELSPEGRSILRTELGREACVMRRKDVGLDRVKIRERLSVELPREIRKVYNALEDDWRSSIGEVEFSTRFAGARWQALRQLADGWLDGSIVHNVKIDEIVEILSGALGQERVVVWASYLAEVSQIALRAGNQVKRQAYTLTGDVDPDERERRIDAWRRSSSGILIAQARILETGADLSASSVAIYFSTPASLVARVQSEDRILSTKTKGPLLIVDVVAEDTVDADLVGALNGKAATSERALSRAVAIAALERRKRK